MAQKKRKLLIAGGGYADIPLIEAGRALGYHVITSGNRPHDLGHRYSDEVRLADFSDPEAMLKIAMDSRVDAVCSSCNDFSALSSAYVAETLGLPGHDRLEVAELIHHKDRYREFARTNGIATPLARGYSSMASALSGLEEFRFPVMVKPVDLTGGKGISRVETIAEGQKAVVRAFQSSRAKRIVIEEYIEGSRHGISTFVRDGKVVFFIFDDEHYFLNPYLVSAASVPGSLSQSVVDSLVCTVERIAGLLELVTGIVHVQFIVDQNGVPIIIEICRRAPGDLYLRLVQHATGVNYPAFIVRAETGMDCAGLSHAEIQGFITRHCIMASKSGKVRDVIFDKSIRHKVIDKLLWWKTGDVIEDVLTQKLGIVFLKFDSRREMNAITPMLQDMIHVDIQ